MQIPTDPQAITAPWLIEALRSTGTIDQTGVKSYDLQLMGDGAGYVGQLARFRLDYTVAEESTPTSLVAKFSSADPAVRATLHATGIYEKEVRFYQELAAQARLPTPRCYYADIDLETGHSILLLEDLAHLRSIDLAAGCTLAEAELVISHLAQFHAHWWENPQLEATGYLTPNNHRAEFWQERFLGWWPQIRQTLAALLPDAHLSPAFVELGHRFGPKLVEIFTQVSQSPITFIHRDIHLDNLLFGVDETDAPITILDWQTAGYGRGVGDVTYFMVFSMPISIRRKAERSLLQSYHNRLLQYGVQGYDFEQCWVDYQKSLFRNLFILAVAVSMLDTSRPHGRANRGSTATRCRL